MSVLKGILISLVVVLVAILGVGGYYIGFNHDGHGTAVPAMQQEQSNTNTNDAKSNQQQQVTEVPVVVEKQVAPEEYLAKMEESLKLIKEATSLIANDSYMANMPLPGVNQPVDPDSTEGNPQVIPQQQHVPSGEAMAKVHQGIYKMAQGITIMEQNIEGMNREVTRARANDMSFYEIPPQGPQYRFYNPYYFNYPNGQYNPYGWNMPNQQYMMPNQYYPNPGSQGAMADPNNHAATGHGANTGNLFSADTFIYVIYIILIGSIVVGIFGIIGFIRSLLKMGGSKQGSDTIAG